MFRGAKTMFTRQDYRTPSPTPIIEIEYDYFFKDNILNFLTYIVCHPDLSPHPEAILSFLNEALKNETRDCDKSNPPILGKSPLQKKIEYFINNIKNLKTKALNPHLIDHDTFSNMVDCAPRFNQWVKDIMHNAPYKGVIIGVTNDLIEEINSLNSLIPSQQYM